MYTEELSRWNIVYNKARDRHSERQALANCGECAERISRLVQEELAPWRQTKMKEPSAKP